MAKHAHIFTEAHEMETLSEGTWYIRGCKELADYFDNNDINFQGKSWKKGFYIENGEWDWNIIYGLKDRKEITLQDYLESLKNKDSVISKMETTSRNQNLFNYLSKEHGVTLLESEIDDIFNAIKQDGYFVFPKAEEGDFPDLSNWEGVEMEGEFGVNNTFVKSNILLKYGDYFLNYGFDITNFVRPIQKQKLTIAELAEKAGLDINNIEIIE